MDLHKLLDTADALKSDSILSRNTSILKSLSFVEPSSTVSTFTSFSQKNTDKDNLKELIDEVTRQDVILSIINKCIEDTGTALNANLKCKIKKIVKFNSFKASYEENNLNDILVLNDGGIDLSSQNDEMKLTDKEAQELNKVIQKFIDLIHTQIVLEKRSSSSKSSIDRIRELQSKIESKYHAIESVMTSIDELQDQMIHLSTEEYRKNVIENNERVAHMFVEQIGKLHENAVISLAQKHAEETKVDRTKNLLDISLPPVEDFLSTLEYSVDSIRLEIDQLESRLSNYRSLESNPSNAAVFKTIRKLQKAIQQKRFVLHVMVKD